MLRTTPSLAFALASTVLLSTAGVATSQTLVHKLDVELDLGLVQNTAAAAHFATLDDDLENAIMQRIVDRIDAGGVTIDIDLSEVELSNFFDQAYNASENRLVGQVNVGSTTENRGFNSYELTILVRDLTPVAAAEQTGATLADSSEAYYDAMIDAFADGVVTRLGE